MALVWLHSLHFKGQEIVLKILLFQDCKWWDTWVHTNGEFSKSHDLHSDMYAESPKAHGDDGEYNKPSICVAGKVCVHMVEHIGKICACVSSPITRGRGKSFHFLDESLADQKPRDPLLQLSALLLSFSLICLFHSIAIDFIHPIPRPLPSTPPPSFFNFFPSLSSL